MTIIGNLAKSMKNLPKKLFGTRNDRILKRMRTTAEAALPFEQELKQLCSEGNDYDSAFVRRSAEIPQPDESDEASRKEYETSLQALRVALSKPLLERSFSIKERIKEGASPEDLMPEAFAIVREASRRAQGHRHFDCQLIGGQTLYEGTVAEMRTGEGKTIVCHLAAYLRASQGMKVHVVTVNDYLVKRDAEFATPVFELLGYTVGYIQSQIDPGGREGIRQHAYACDLTYGTASEFGFDYLRDNMKTSLAAQVQGRLDYVIIDEVDSILIDEARTPLIIAGPTSDDPMRYKRADAVALELVRRQKSWDQKVRSTVVKYDGDDHNIPKLGDAMKILGHRKRGGKNAEAETAAEKNDHDNAPTLGPDFLTDDQVEAIQIYQNNVLRMPPSEHYRRFYIVQHERKAASITHEGVSLAQEQLDIGSLYSGANMEWPHLIENAIRAHATYVRDRDYVVKDGAVVIVDPFTGRLMVGRQWSDGLHQAVEAKERVQVKEETQTLATITIQNFFKLYKKMAGMTGTAMTEAEEFMKIYKLDVIEIPTNRPVNRLDHNDKMFRDEEQKYNAIVDEIHEIHRRGRPADPFLLADIFKALRPVIRNDQNKVERTEEAIRRFNNAELGDTATIAFMCEVYDEVMGDLAHGRPILVGTTSVENSEKLSRLLERRYGIEHEVLNAKNHAREAEIVMKAGQLSVPLAGGGKDKRPLGGVTIATNMAGRGTDIKLGEGVVNPGCKVPEELPEGLLQSDLYPIGVTKCCIHCDEYDPVTNCAHCWKPKLDARFPEMGRKVCALSSPCGLHIIGTERHESRRIDNQLRGRSGRQGDPGSSRFALSLQDDLLKLFMSEWMLKMMERLGFVEGTSLEDKRLTKGIERAQRKVEERNFSSRKHLLEWDEPMDYQRKEFYRSRQAILEGKGLTNVIFTTINETVRSTVDRFLSHSYRQECIAEWCRSNLDVNIGVDQIRADDLEETQDTIRKRAKDECFDQIQTTFGEYVDREESPNNWDTSGLLRWAEQRGFKVGVTQNQMRKMDADEIENELLAGAEAHFDEVDLEGVSIYLDADYPNRALADWANAKFALDLDANELIGKSISEAVTALLDRVRAAYECREVSYPVEQCLERAFGEDATDNAAAAEHVLRWVNTKYRVDWKLEDIQGKDRDDLYRKIVDLNEQFLKGDRLEREIETATADRSHEQAVEWARERFGPAFNEEQVAKANGQLKEALMSQGREMLRWELARLEQFVLLRIYDQAWKDHLLEMDHLKTAIMQRPLGGDQTHPVSQYAIEGRDMFAQMWGRIADRVTDVIFKVRMGAAPSQTAGTSMPISMSHADATGSGFAGAARDEQAAMRAQGEQPKAETIRRDQPRVKRNDPCPCGSGKKFKQCHGRSG